MIQVFAEVFRYNLYHGPDHNSLPPCHFRRSGDPRPACISGFFDTPKPPLFWGILWLFYKLFFKYLCTIECALNGKYSPLTVSLLICANCKRPRKRRAGANGEVFPLPPIATWCRSTTYAVTLQVFFNTTPLEEWSCCDDSSDLSRGIRCESPRCPT